MWIPYNPNPLGKNTNDCTIRTICAVTGLSWNAAHDALCALSGEMADIPSTDDVWWAFLNGIGFEQIHIPDRCPDCYTVQEFAEDHPEGVYIVGPWQHCVAVINGDWWDSWDSRLTVPYYYFRRIKNDVSESDVPEPGVAESVPVPGTAAADQNRGGRTD